jgi:hypothetical protein
MVRELGIIDEAYETARGYRDTACDALLALPPGPERDSLAGLADYVLAAESAPSPQLRPGRRCGSDLPRHPPAGLSPGLRTGLADIGRLGRRPGAHLLLPCFGMLPLPTRPVPLLAAGGRGLFSGCRRPGPAVIGRLTSLPRCQYVPCRCDEGTVANVNTGDRHDALTVLVAQGRDRSDARASAGP